MQIPAPKKPGPHPDALSAYLSTPQPDERRIREQYLTKPQVAARLQVSLRSIDNMIRHRRIPVCRWGRTVRFYWPKVEAALARYEVKEVK
jgi:excisionase family DNA binding protein